MSAGENASEDAAPGPDLSAIVALMTRPALWRDYGMTGKVSVLFYKGEDKLRGRPDKGRR